MIENNGIDLLKISEEAAKNNVDLTDGQKTKYVNLIADYGISLFGLNPLPVQYQLLAIATIDLIPGLKSKFGSPTVSLACCSGIYINGIIVISSFHNVSVYIKISFVI